MSNYATLKAAIQAAVYTNGSGDITGAGLQTVLLQIVNTVGDGYVFKGVATGGTSAGTPDANVFYIAPAGTYTNFGSTYTVGDGKLGIFMYNGSWSKSTITIGASGGGDGGSFIQPTYCSNAKLSSSLKLVFYNEAKQAVIRGKTITDIIVDCYTLGTFSVIKASKEDVNAMSASQSDLAHTVVETFTLDHYGWQKLHLSSALFINSDECIGFFATSDTAQLGYRLVSVSGKADFVAPYNGWYFGRTEVLPSNYTLNVGVVTMESAGQFHPIEESCVGLYSIYADAEMTESTPNYQYGGYFLAEATQQFLRGKTITHVRVNTTSTGFLRIVVGTWTDSYADAWFDTSEVISVEEVGYHVYRLQKPVTLGANDWLGFNGDAKVVTSTGNFNVYSDPKAFCFWNGASLVYGYLAEFQAIVTNDEQVRALEIYRPTKLAGKNVVLMGDSISSYNGLNPVGYEHYYPQGDVNNWILTWWAQFGFMQSLKWVENTEGGYKYNNRSWSGSKVTNLQGGDKPYCSTARLSTLGDPDVVLLFGGINDLAGGTPHPQLGTDVHWGDMASMDLSEFKDAYAYCVEYILTNYPTAKLICMTPTQISTLGHFTDNDMGVDFADITEAIKEICDKYGVSVIDMGKCGITYLNTDEFTLDGVHPNKAGMKVIADYVNEQINDIL